MNINVVVYYPPSLNATGASIQVFHTFLGDSQNYKPRGVVDHLMNYRPRPKAEGDSSSGGPQHRGADTFDCRLKRYEIDVLLTNSYLKELFLLTAKINKYWELFDHVGGR